MAVNILQAAGAAIVANPDKVAKVAGAWLFLTHKDGRGLASLMKAEEDVTKWASAMEQSTIWFKWRHYLQAATRNQLAHQVGLSLQLRLLRQLHWPDANFKVWPPSSRPKSVQEHIPGLERNGNKSQSWEHLWPGLLWTKQRQFHRSGWKWSLGPLEALQDSGWAL